MKERRERERRRKTQRTKGFSFLHPCITVRRGKQNNGEGKKRKSKLKPVERDEDAEKKTRDRRKHRIEGKGLKQMNTDRLAITPSTSL
jgi:hypothetical protein